MACMGGNMRHLGQLSVKAGRIAAVAILAASFLTGCVTNTAVLQDFQDNPSKIGFSVVDARPDDDKSTGFLSFMISSCDYGIRELGDEATSPSRLEILRSDMEAALKEQLANKTMTVSHYAIFFNINAILRNTNPYTGGLADLVISPHDRQKEDISGGWYTRADVTTPYSPIIVEIKAKLDAKDYTVHSVYSPQEELPQTFGTPYAASALLEAIRKAHHALIDEVRGSGG